MDQQHFSHMHEGTMAKTNFQYEKRQRELEKKRKAEEKARRKLESKQHKGEEGDSSPEQDSVEVVERERDSV
jgi:hypothetical protein